MTKEQSTEQYNEYLTGHIGNVSKALELLYTLDIPYVKEHIDELREIVKEHDASKYEEPEWSAYLHHFYPTNEEEEMMEEEFDAAVQHHIKNNKHHWNYWCDEDNNLKNDIDEEEYKLYTIERICDWLAMAAQHDEGPTEYYDINKDYIVQPDYARTLCDDIFPLIPNDYNKDMWKVTRGELDEDFLPMNKEVVDSLGDRVKRSKTSNTIEIDTQMTNHDEQLDEMDVVYPKKPKEIIAYEYYNDNGEYVIDLKDGWEDPVGNSYIIEKTKREAYRILKQCTKVINKKLDEALTAQQIDQLKRAKEYLANNPDDPDIQEVIDKIAELEADYNAPLKERVPDMFEKTKELIKSTLGESFFADNDTNPTISIDNLGPNRGGLCTYSLNRYTREVSNVRISINKYLENYSDDMLFAVIIHEYVHSLRCCIFGGSYNGGHNSTWKRIADRLSKEIGMSADRFMNVEEIDNMTANYQSKRKSYYKITCQHCGKEQYRYSGSADIVKYPEHYKHRCPDGERGEFKVEKVINEALVESVLNEMKLSQIKQKSKNQDPARIAKSKNVKTTYLGMSKFGILNFKTTSESRSGYHYQTVEFKDMKPFEDIIKAGKEIMPNDIKVNLQNQDVNVWCTDESFAYWAWAHQAYKNDFLYIDDRIPNLKKAIQAPTVNNVRLNGGACKHILSVVDYVMKPFVLLAISEDMNKFLAGNGEDKMQKQPLGVQNQYDQVAQWDWSEMEELLGKSRIEIMSDISKTLQIIPKTDVGDIIEDIVGEALPAEEQGLKREIVDRVEELVKSNEENS